MFDLWGGSKPRTVAHRVQDVYAMRGVSGKECTAHYRTHAQEQLHANY